MQVDVVEANIVNKLHSYGKRVNEHAYEILFAEFAKKSTTKGGGVVTRQTILSLIGAPDRNVILEIPYNTSSQMEVITPAIIRTFLMVHFDDTELHQFCHDYFRQVSQDFTIGMTKRQKIGHLIEYCERHEQMTDLITGLRADRKEQFQMFIKKSAME